MYIFLSYLSQDMSIGTLRSLLAEDSGFFELGRRMLANNEKSMG